MSIGIAIAVVVAVALALWLVFRRKPQLPPEAAQPPKPALKAEPAARAEPERAATPAATPAPTAPTAPAAPAAAPPPAPVAPVAVVEAPAPEPTVDPERVRRVAALRKGLASTRGGFISRLAKLFGGRGGEIDPGLLEEIEEVLITADIGVKTTARILDALREQMQRGELSDEASIWAALRTLAVDILAVSAPAITLANKPALVLVVGVNGVGKTTTIGKLAARYSAEGKKVLLAAGDTYRAAAVLQLEVWGQRVGCPVVKGKEGADPGSVIFDAVKKAQNEGFDLVIADTAGRLHTKAPLMDELKKVDRTVQKALGDRRADEILLVLDSTTGQNAVQQMHMFRQALDVTGVALTKLDGTAKGGVILGIVDEHKLPVRFIGLGEKVEDLREFDVESFVQALFERPEDEANAA
jgi:fused signal recognition particle receptor